ncbi:hypothetical protein RBI80_24765 [Klebsiella variicola]|nr:hypothetical protein RBI80_24765 [Klebsiella variicola]
MANQSEINWARICKLPLQIVMMGISIFIVAKLFTYLGLHPVSWPSKETGSGFKAFIALIVFLVGTGMVSFLWWLSSRYFRLLGCAGENIDKVAQLKDLPMGLPEGTVRAVLALIVAVVGLPLLLFSSQLSASRRLPGISMALLPAFLAITLAPGRQLQRLRQIISSPVHSKRRKSKPGKRKERKMMPTRKWSLPKKYKVRRMSILCSTKRNGS